MSKKYLVQNMISYYGIMSKIVQYKRNLTQNNESSLNCRPIQKEGIT